jgi:hypothetical protein
VVFFLLSAGWPRHSRGFSLSLRAPVDVRKLGRIAVDCGGKFFLFLVEQLGEELEWICFRLWQSFHDVASQCLRWVWRHFLRKWNFFGCHDYLLQLVVKLCARFARFQMSTDHALILWRYVHVKSLLDQESKSAAIHLFTGLSGLTST